MERRAFGLQRLGRAPVTAAEAGKQRGKLTWENRLSWAVRCLHGQGLLWSRPTFPCKAGVAHPGSAAFWQVNRAELPAAPAWCQPAGKRKRSGGGGGVFCNPVNFRASVSTAHSAESAQPVSFLALQRLGGSVLHSLRWITSASSDLSLKFKAQRDYWCKYGY